jgi:hypothetical protein
LAIGEESQVEKIVGFLETPTYLHKERLHPPRPEPAVNGEIQETTVQLFGSCRLRWLAMVQEKHSDCKSMVT